MIQFKFISSIVFLFFISSAFSQENMEDVLYLKNGNIYRGMIIEQIPGESLKIRSEGGNVYVVTILELQKITKEEKWNVGPKTPITPTPPMATYRKAPRYYRDSTYVPHYLKKKTYFFLAELRGGPMNGGVRVVNGYKIGRFGFFGVGVGIDGVSFGQAYLKESGTYGSQGFSNGAYLPIYFRYSGDILKTRITPFYYAELGYAAKAFLPFQDSDVRSFGGPIGAVGFGCKFNTRRRVNFNLNLNATWRTNFYKGNFYSYDDNGNYYTVFASGSDGSLFGNFSFGIGF